MKAVGSNAKVSTILLPERVDSETSTAVEASILAKLRSGARLIVDGSEVSYMSAAGVRVLATVLHRAQEVQARIVFCRFTGAAADCLLVSGFGQFLDVAESTEEAAAKLQQES